MITVEFTSTNLSDNRGFTLVTKQHLWQQIELASESESDLQDTMYWGRKWLLISMLEELN